MNADVASELREVLGYYELGELAGWERNDRGYVNTSYAVETVVDGERHRYFLRRYKQGIKEHELRFEHSVINHLTEQGFDLVARLFETKDGRTFVRRAEGKDRRDDVFYAVFGFLPGEDRYTCINPACSDREVENAAAVLARFHDTVFGFTPDGKRDEPGILALLPKIGENVAKGAEKTKHTPFDAYLLEYLWAIQNSVVQTHGALSAAERAQMVHLVIHCDYHPGNLKFQNGDITGLFDFDWSKIDARCFDVALAMLYFFAAWEEERDGTFDLNQTALFLKAYQSALRCTPGLGPLSGLELKCLPHMLNASNLYVLNWAVEDFYGKEVDPQEYLIWLRHGVQVMRWLENKDNWRKLERTIESARV
jgi:homoserine kinase type II